MKEKSKSAPDISTKVGLRKVRNFLDTNWGGGQYLSYWVNFCCCVALLVKLIAYFGIYCVLQICKVHKGK